MQISSVTSATSKTGALNAEQLELRKAAEGFEAIMVRRLLEAARATSFAKDNTPFTGGGMETFTKMRDEQFADIAADTGSFGFARSIEEQLAQYLPAKPSDQPSPENSAR